MQRLQKGCRPEREARQPNRWGGLHDPTPQLHGLMAAEAGRRLGIDLGHGLDAGLARDRLVRHGENRLTEKPPRSRWLKSADQFRSLLIIVLLAAAFLAPGDVVPLEVGDSAPADRRLLVTHGVEIEEAADMCSPTTTSPPSLVWRRMAG